MIEVTAKLVFIISRPSLNNNYLEKRSKMLHKLFIEKTCYNNFCLSLHLNFHNSKILFI